MPEAYAEEDGLGERVSSWGEALEKANAYSFKNGSIGIIIGYGTGNEGTPQRIGDAFVNEIKRRGQKARYFYYDADWPGVAMSYRVGYSALGPWSADEAASHIGDAVRRLEAMRKIHGH